MAGLAHSFAHLLYARLASASRLIVVHLELFEPLLRDESQRDICVDFALGKRYPCSRHADLLAQEQTHKDEDISGRLHYFVSSGDSYIWFQL